MRCDNDGSMCDLVMEICVSKPNSRDCEYIKYQTGVLGETILLQFGGSIGGLPNPLEIDLGLTEFKVCLFPP